MNPKNKIVLFPDSRLFTKTHEVTLFDESLHKVLDEMKEVMLSLNGLGIASNQIGYSASMFLMKQSASGDIVEIINPKILSISSGTQTYNEGCLSAPGIFVPTIRPKEVNFTYQNGNGEFLEGIVEGLEAIIFSHENEHLSGRLFLNHTTRPQRKLALKKLNIINPMN